MLPHFGLGDSTFSVLGGKTSREKYVEFGGNFAISSVIFDILTLVSGGSLAFMIVVLGGLGSGASRFAASIGGLGARIKIEPLPLLHWAGRLCFEDCGDVESETEHGAESLTRLMLNFRWCFCLGSDAIG